MKALLLIALLAAPLCAQTTAQLEAQIAALQAKVDSTLADSTAVVSNALVRADSTLLARGIKVVNLPHQNGNYDSQWVAFDLSALRGADKTYGIKFLKMEHKGQVQGDFVRIRKDRVPAAMATLKDLLK